MCTHSYCFPSALVIWSTSAALQRIYLAAVPCFSLEFKSLWTDEEMYWKRVRKRAKKVQWPLKRGPALQQHRLSLMMLWDVRSGQTKALDHPTWQNYWETSVYCKTSTSCNTAQTSHLNWPAEKDIRCIFILCTSKCTVIHSVTFLLFFSFTLSHKPFSSVSFLFFYLAPLLSGSYCLLSPISSKNWRDKEYVFQNRLGENDNCKWKRQRLRSLMSLPQHRVAGFLKSAGSSVHFSSSLKWTPNEMLLDSLFKGNLPLFISLTVSVAFAVKVKCVIFLMFKYILLFQLMSVNYPFSWYSHKI